MELWDLLDADGNPLGRTIVRGEKLPEGTYHRVVDIFTVNSRGELLVTLRSPDKEVYPNMWEVTGGSAVAGEEAAAAAVRELREETGIDVPVEWLEFMVEIRRTGSISDLYLLHYDAEISELTMQEGETVAAKWVTLDDFEKMADNGEIPEPVIIRYNKVKHLICNIK